MKFKYLVIAYGLKNEINIETLEELKIIRDCKNIEETLASLIYNMNEKEKNNYFLKYCKEIYQIHNIMAEHDINEYQARTLIEVYNDLTKTNLL